MLRRCKVRLMTVRTEHLEGQLRKSCIAQLLPARSNHLQTDREAASVQSLEAGASPQKKGGRMTASDFMASSTTSVKGIVTPTFSHAVLPGDLQSTQRQSSPNSIHAPSEADSVEFIVASQTTSFPSFSASCGASTEAVATVTPASIDQIDRPLSDCASTSTSSTFIRCRFGVTCINVNCKFAHPSPSAGKERNGYFPKSAETCSAGVTCRDPICPKVHPSPAQRRNDLCRDQENCPYGMSKTVTPASKGARLIFLCLCRCKVHISTRCAAYKADLCE